MWIVSGLPIARSYLPSKPLPLSFSACLGPSLRQDGLRQMTARSATVRLSRTALIAVSPAVIVCVSADLFCLPERSKATASIPPPKSVCLSSSRSSAAFSSATTASASSPRVWTQLVTRRTQRSIQRIHPSLSSSLRVTRSPPGCVVQASHFRGKDNRKDSEEELPSLFRIAHYL